MIVPPSQAWKLLLAITLAAAIVLSACASALASWLPRGTDSEGPPRDEEPVDQQPPPEPDGLHDFSWAAFEHAFRAYSERERERAGVR